MSVLQSRYPYVGPGVGGTYSWGAGPRGEIHCLSYYLIALLYLLPNGILCMNEVRLQINIRGNFQMENNLA